MRSLSINASSALVQESLARLEKASGYRRSSSDALLTGKLFDHLGRPMTPSHAVKGGVRYRYYISRASAGSSGDIATAIVRLSAPDIEEAVVKALTSKLDETSASETGSATRAGPIADDSAARRSISAVTLVERVCVRSGAIEIEFVQDVAASDGAPPIVVPLSRPPARVQREIILPSNGQCDDPRAMSSDTRSRAMAAIAVSRRWVKDLASGRIESIEALATREGRSSRSVTMLLSLTFLVPDLVKAIVDNCMPRGIGLTNLTDLPGVWNEQWKALGLSA